MSSKTKLPLESYIANLAPTSGVIISVLSVAYTLVNSKFLLITSSNTLTFTSKEVEGFFKQIEKVLITYVDRKIG